MNEQPKQNSGVSCVKCGQPATVGTLKYPLCEPCMDKHFKGDHAAYWKFVGKHLG